MPRVLLATTNMYEVEARLEARLLVNDDYGLGTTTNTTADRGSEQERLLIRLQEILKRCQARRGSAIVSMLNAYKPRFAAAADIHHYHQTKERKRRTRVAWRQRGAQVYSCRLRIAHLFYLYYLFRRFHRDIESRLLYCVLF